MVADYHYFLPSDGASIPPRVFDKMVEERGMVVWHPPPSYTLASAPVNDLKNDNPGDHEHEEEDTDLLNLRVRNLNPHSQAQY